jgi:RNA polymerase sigma-70 factor (ECF subfamily)
VDQPLAHHQSQPLSRQDQEALSALKRGQWAAIEHLVQTYQDRLYSTMYRIVQNPDDAADLVQESFVRAMQNVGGFKGDSSLYTWLFRIAVNLALTQKRTQKRRGTLSLDDGSDVNRQAAGLKSRLDQSRESDPAHAAEVRLDHQRLVEAMADLDPSDRALLILRDVEECSYEHISEIMEAPLGTVKSRLFRARLALRSAVDADDLKRAGKSDRVQP